MTRRDPRKSYNTADEEDVAEMREKEKRLTREQIDDVKWVLSTPQGRRFYWRLLSQCGLFTSSFSIEASHMAFAEGERNVGLKLFDAMNIADPSSYVTMMQENKGDEDDNG